METHNFGWNKGWKYPPLPRQGAVYNLRNLKNTKTKAPCGIISIAVFKIHSYLKIERPLWLVMAKQMKLYNLMTLHQLIIQSVPGFSARRGETERLNFSFPNRWLDFRPASLTIIFMCISSHQLSDHTYQKLNW